MRVAIIKQKFDEKGIKITPEATSFLANNIESNIREIEGKLQQLSVQSIASGVEEVNLSFVQHFSNPNESFNDSPAKIQPRHIVSVCAKHFNIKTSDLTGKSRKKELVLARHITAYLLLTEGNIPLEETGRLLGGRDHTSIMHARDKIHTSFSTNPQTRQLINQIKADF
jgi:chromosomal replication initiator protein